jgi:hypothetical protein
VLVDLKGFMASRGFYRGDASSPCDEATEKALDAFIASENFEERVDLKQRTIDVPVLTHLRARSVSNEQPDKESAELFARTRLARSSNRQLSVLAPFCRFLRGQ